MTLVQQKRVKGGFVLSVSDVITLEWASGDSFQPMTRLAIFYLLLKSLEYIRRPLEKNESPSWVVPYANARRTVSDDDENQSRGGKQPKTEYSDSKQPGFGSREGGSSSQPSSSRSGFRGLISGMGQVRVQQPSHKVLQVTAMVENDHWYQNVLPRGTTYGRQDPGTPSSSYQHYGGSATAAYNKRQPTSHDVRGFRAAEDRLRHEESRRRATGYAHRR